MVFVGAGQFLHMVAAYRTLWIYGRLGGGKTTLAVWISAWLVAMGYADYTISNGAMTFATKPLVPLKDTVILLDEAWLYIEDWSSVKSYASFLRKNNLFLIMPSVFEVHHRLRKLTVHRFFNAMVAGVPLWVYRWDLASGSIKERGYFGVWAPLRATSHFDSEEYQSIDDDGGISDAINRTFATKARVVSKPPKEIQATAANSVPATRIGITAESGSVESAEGGIPQTPGPTASACTPTASTAPAGQPASGKKGDAAGSEAGKSFEAASEAMADNVDRLAQVFEKISKIGRR